ncbi:MAG: rRNA maturation RNase YbeY [Treponema sp.]|nr:rRNA maturation RNase YbeY [Treponema sp.]
MANRVEVNFQGTAARSWAKNAALFASRALKKYGRDNWELSILFCTNGLIRELNAKFRAVDEATDVLSFVSGAYNGPFYLAGDIVISLDALAENASFFDVCAEDELRRLLIHGILHLDGMDHATNDAAEPMLKKQEALLAELQKAPPIIQKKEKR